MSKSRPPLLKHLLVLVVALTMLGATADGREVRMEGELVDIEGTVHRPLEDAAVKAVVLVFIVPDCPICKAYMPELNRLQSDYGRRGVRLFLLHTDRQLSREPAQKHAREYQLKPPVILDSQHTWVRRLGATITPEAAVLSSEGKLRYRGRIDNRFPRIGQQRTQVTSRDLRDALDAVLAERPVTQPRTEAVGCHIEVLENKR